MPKYYMKTDDTEKHTLYNCKSIIFVLLPSDKKYEVGIVTRLVQGKDGIYMQFYDSGYPSDTTSLLKYLQDKKIILQKFTIGVHDKFLPLRYSYGIFLDAELEKEIKEKFGEDVFIKLEEVNPK